MVEDPDGKIIGFVFANITPFRVPRLLSGHNKSPAVLHPHHNSVTVKGLGLRYGSSDLSLSGVMRPVSSPTPHLQRTTPRSPMAASSPSETELNGMNDPRLKPRILRSLAMDHLPDEKQPSPIPDELSSVLSSVKTHGLLSEIQSHPPDRKQIDEWRSSVDAWVECLLSLVSCNMISAGLVFAW